MQKVIHTDLTPCTLNSTVRERARAPQLAIRERASQEYNNENPNAKMHSLVIEDAVASRIQKRRKRMLCKRSPALAVEPRGLEETA